MRVLAFVVVVVIQEDVLVDAGQFVVLRIGQLSLRVFGVYWPV